MKSMSWLFIGITIVLIRSSSGLGFEDPTFEDASQQIPATRLPVGSDSSREVNQKPTADATRVIPSPAMPPSRPASAPTSRSNPPTNLITSALAAPDTNTMAPRRANAAAIARANLAGAGPTFVPNMFGDQPPATIRLNASGATSTGDSGRPPRPPGPGPVAAQSREVVPSARGFKIADNQSPEPRDRFFYTFNYFDDLNGSVNRQIQSPTVSERAYRHLFGFEKTFFQGDASLGFRLPVNTFTINNPLASDTTTSVGDLSIFGKYLLWRDPQSNSLISTGLAVTAPTGPRNFAGAPSLTGFRSTSLQPFLGGIYRKERFYAQAFEAIDIATNHRDVSLIYNDFAVGYFLYQAKDPKAIITAIVPTFETHVNIPLNHRGAQRMGDISATADQVNLSFGTTFIVKQNASISVSFVQPVVGPNAFHYEASVLFNYYFGRSRNARPVLTPPIVGL